MRFKISVLDVPKHTDFVTCVGWMSPDEVYSAGDDHQLLQWNLLANETKKIADLEGVFPLELHWLPKVATHKTNVSSDVFLMTGADGRFYIINRSGRIEKSVDAHRGAVLAGRWSHDGMSLLTAGEDGFVKIWSRSGMLRSTLAQTSVAVYSASWSPDSDSVLYTNGMTLIIKPLAPSSKPIQWKAHEGIILKVAWNLNTGLILSGSEDTKYKVWDSYGRQLYCSVPHHHPITSLAWSADGELFAVGSYNTIRLCDKAGWSHSLEKPNTGSILNLHWSSDGTQIAGACANGHVLFGHIVERQLDWKNYEATVVNRTTVVLRNVTNEAREKLEFRDRIIKASLSHGHLVTVTSKQIYIYSTSNWNTPIIVELKDGNVSLVIQANRYFLIVDGANVLIYSYEGRLICVPKWQGMRPDVLGEKTLSLSNDTLAVRDKTDEKLVFLFDAASGKPLNDGKPWIHKVEIKQLALDQVGKPNDRKLAVLDKNQDLLIVPVTRVGRIGRPAKLSAMVDNLCWCNSSNQLALLQGTLLLVWHCPAIIFMDRDLLSLSVTWKEGSDFGKNAVIVNFLDNVITLRRADGSLVCTAISPYPGLLHNYVAVNQWSDAVRLARFVKEENLWACLAGLATAAKDLDTAETAYAAINRAEKVKYIQYIKNIPIKEVRQAEMALLAGHISDAETILLQSGHYFRAIMLNITSHQWERALQLAVKHKMHIDTVIAYRLRYLARFGKKETIQIFIKCKAETEVDFDKIEENIELEYQKERERPASVK